MEDFYNIKISPETILGDLSVVDYEGTPVGVYSAMTQVVSSGVNGSSILTGLTIPILIRQSAVDAGYYSPFDGAVLQKDVVAKFIILQMNFKSFWIYLLIELIGVMVHQNKQ
jgi:hypothetical protein